MNKHCHKEALLQYSKVETYRSEKNMFLKPTSGFVRHGAITPIVLQLHHLNVSYTILNGVIDGVIVWFLDICLTVYYKNMGVV